MKIKPGEEKSLRPFARNETDANVPVKHELLYPAGAAQPAGKSIIEA